MDVLFVVYKKFQISIEAFALFNYSKNASLVHSIIAYFRHYHAISAYSDSSAIACNKPNSICNALRRHLKLAASDREVNCLFEAIEYRVSLSDMDIVVI
jgi:hypothetical protein